jgi:hypothetical protein
MNSAIKKPNVPVGDKVAHGPSHVVRGRSVTPQSRSSAWPRRRRHSSIVSNLPSEDVLFLFVRGNHASVMQVRRCD